MLPRYLSPCSKSNPHRPSSPACLPFPDPHPIGISPWLKKCYQKHRPPRRPRSPFADPPSKIPAAVPRPPCFSLFPFVYVHHYLLVVGLIDS
ncbi:hypothetical protein B0O99DRAFT_627500 [Bisporella sp. PMI_857]|nr:hypothetical protein B0O99DRAFT_627500 [Bisporella sp. PMI_857]